VILSHYAIRRRFSRHFLGPQKEPFRQLAMDFAGFFGLARLGELRMLSSFRQVLGTFEHGALSCRGGGP
jgi:hypothetical protein